MQLFRAREESKSAEERENISKKNVQEKRKPVSDITDEQSPAKKQKDAGENRKKVHEKDKALLKNVDEKDNREEIKTQVEELDIKKEERTKDSIPEKARVFTDQCTAFISNLHLKASTHSIFLHYVVSLILIVTAFCRQIQKIYINFSATLVE